MGALDAKKQKNHKKQEYFSGIIRKIRHQLVSLGLSDEILAPGFPPEDTSSTYTEDGFCDSRTNEVLQSTLEDDNDGLDRKLEVFDGLEDGSIKDSASILDSLVVPKNVVITKEIEGPEYLELDNLFSEDASSSAISFPDVLKSQKKMKPSQSVYGSMLGKVDDIWRKGDSNMIPKAVLQRFCQRLGWEAPKYNRLLEKENGLLYAVTILRTASGRGKSRKAGGLITIQLPDGKQSCDSAEDAQNNVAAFALSCLFSDISIHHLLREPYASLVKNWNEEESTNEVDNDEETRRMGFVDSLLNAQISDSVDHVFEESSNLENEFSYSPSRSEEIINHGSPDVKKHKEAENRLLQEEWENIKMMPKYMEMLQTRSTLPITRMRNHLLQLLKINDVIVICGETGCGKTTQVPQFILDDMIESRLGGHCNIICTQPRRIAAISVAERVSDERCEPSPGHHGSLVGFQVRLESSRNERTKLLFCTTGILLRRLAGDNNLEGVTHIIVDEVHERTLLGDFLLIILKNLVERRSNTSFKLKVILMSATVDANLFTGYFNNCPVITAEGRIHPVSSFFPRRYIRKTQLFFAFRFPSIRKKFNIGKRKAWRTIY